MRENLGALVGKLRAMMGGGANADVVGELPVDPVLAQNQSKVRDLALEMLPVLCRDHRRSELVDRLGSMIGALTMLESTETMAMFDWRGAIELLERCETLLPEGLDQRTRGRWDELIAAARACSKGMVVEVMSFRLTGREDDLKELLDNLASLAVDHIETAQDELAERYGWTRGTTTCCTRKGFNPPAGTKLPPAHDVIDPRDAARNQHFGGGQSPYAVEDLIDRLRGRDRGEGR